MKHLVSPNSGPRHRAMKQSAAIKPFAATKTFAATKSFATLARKFLLAGGSLMLLAGCNPGDWHAKFNQWLAPQKQERDYDRMAQRGLIYGRLLGRKHIANLLTSTWRTPGLGEYRAGLVANLPRYTVSQVAGEYDTAVIKCLGVCAGGLDRLPATEAAEQLIAIISICPESSMSMRLVKEALMDALKNPALEWGTTWRIRNSLDKETVPLLIIPDMPPCCVSPREPGQTRLDSLALRMMTEK